MARCGRAEIKKGVENDCMLIAVNPKVELVKENRLVLLLFDNKMQVQCCNMQSTAENKMDPT
jgi:hypothetical protein